MEDAHTHTHTDKDLASRIDSENRKNLAADRVCWPRSYVDASEMLRGCYMCFDADRASPFSAMLRCVIARAVVSGVV